jgi:hypothetical protein
MAANERVGARSSARPLQIGPCFFHQCSRTRASMHAADGWPDVRPVAPLGWILRNPWNCNTCTGRVPTSRRPRRVGNWGSERDREICGTHAGFCSESGAHTRSVTRRTGQNGNLLVLSGQLYQSTRPIDALRGSIHMHASSKGGNGTGKERKNAASSHAVQGSPRGKGGRTAY